MRQRVYWGNEESSVRNNERTSQQKTHNLAEHVNITGHELFVTQTHKLMGLNKSPTHIWRRNYASMDAFNQLGQKLTSFKADLQGNNITNESVPNLTYM